MFVLTPLSILVSMCFLCMCASAASLRAHTAVVWFACYLSYSDKFGLSRLLLLACGLWRLGQHIAEGPSVQHVLRRKRNLNMEHTQNVARRERERKQKSALRDRPWQGVRTAAGNTVVLEATVKEGDKDKSDVRRESPAEKVSIAVVSSQCGAVCRSRLRAAVEYSRTLLSSD